jgi:alpha-tubulin suppressor-like RCC1 family protein
LGSWTHALPPLAYVLAGALLRDVASSPARGARFTHVTARQFPGLALRSVVVAVIVGLVVCVASAAAEAAPMRVTLKRAGTPAVAGSPVSLQVRTRVRRGRFIKRHTVSYGDGTRLRRGLRKPRTLRHTYARAGRYRVTLTLIDNVRRRAVGRLWITVRAPAPARAPAPPPPLTATPAPLPAPPPPLAAGTIAAGYRHVCLVVAAGGVACQGQGISGQLGDGGVGYAVTPVAVSGITDATAVAAGAFHSCALRSGGTVWCWGGAEHGQLGNGAASLSLTPVQVAGITNATAISAGGDHSCALLATGGVVCWGSNVYGQIGSGGSLYALTPEPVAGITNATAIAAGGIHEGLSHSCAVLATGQVMCWGSDLHGELGNGVAGYSPTPVAVTGIANAKIVAAGAAHSCAVLATGQASCWGSNANGQLGNGAQTNALTPTPVSALANITAIAAGGAMDATGHTCAVLSDRRVWCWGRFGGNGSASSTTTPMPVGPIDNATAIAAGGDQSCAVLTPFAFRCWGYTP